MSKVRNEFHLNLWIVSLYQTRLPVDSIVISDTLPVDSIVISDTP